MVQENVVLENVTIGVGSYRNFSGVETAFNKSGERKFSIFLPDEVADILTEAGWYVKRKPPYREGGDPVNQMDIGVSFKLYPPTVKLTSYDGVVSYLNEDSIGILDNVDIAHADLELRPYNWEVNGKRGVKAYLKELTVKAKPPRRSINASMSANDYD